MKAEVIVPRNRQTIALRRIPQRTVVRWTAALLAAMAIVISIALAGWTPTKTTRGPDSAFVTDAAQCALPAPDGSRCPPGNTVLLPRMTIDQVFMELSRYSR